MQDKPKKVLTLCVVHKHPKVLLGMKKRGFGEGRWNGFGGKVEPGESIEDAAVRELREEACVEARDIKKMGVVEFDLASYPEILEVHVFKATDIKGEPRETDEMRPAWFDAADIPFKQMWQDDEHWFPLFLADKKFRGKFLFDKNDVLLDVNLREVEEA